jgi:beta-glucosidase
LEFQRTWQKQHTMTSQQKTSREWSALNGLSESDERLTDKLPQSLLAQMTLEEKVDQMSGDIPYLSCLFQMMIDYANTPYRAGVNSRLNIPGITFSDGPRGIVRGRSTCFPVPMARGASWDIDLEQRIGEAIGFEGSVQGINTVAAPCINVLRHPAWGRAQETYGEDPYHLGEMGAALVRGLQKHLMSCVKHYACNSIENTRTKVNVQIGERTLREIYLPAFKRCVDAGAASVMSAYNQINGQYCGENLRLLREILKEEWGFSGFVMSDFVFGVHDGKRSAMAGLDIEMPSAHYYGKKLVKLVKQGEVPEELINEAVLRILRQKIRFSQVGTAPRNQDQALASQAHSRLAREAALKSVVLLKNQAPYGQTVVTEQIRTVASLFSFERPNPSKMVARMHEPTWEVRGNEFSLHEPVLPFDAGRLQRLALVGELAVKPNLGSHGSSDVHPPQVVTILQGLQELAAGRFELTYSSGRAPSEAASLARVADASVIVVGYTPKDEGENLFARGGDRATLSLQDIDVALILAIAAANPRTVVVIISGGPVIIENWAGFIPAILMAWYPGMEGGRALAELLLGLANPSGKLPFAVPKSPEHLPPFDNKSRQVEYGSYHGYRWLDKKPQRPAYPFGFGLSYTTFEYHNLRVLDSRLKPQDTLLVEVDVANTGSRQGDEITQVYISPPATAVDRPVKELKGFTRLSLSPGEQQTARFSVPVASLAFYDESTAAWAVEHGLYQVYAGGSSDLNALQAGDFIVFP